MSKMHEQKRKAKLAERAKYESLCFQVWRGRNKLIPGLSDDDLLVKTELENIRQTGSTEDILAIRDIVRGVKSDFGVMPEPDRGTLNGSAVAYLLEITVENPFEKGLEHSTLAKIEELPLQATIYYDNEIRNKVVDWIKNRYPRVTTRFGQPILKLSKTVIEIGRVVKS